MYKVSAGEEIFEIDFSDEKFLINGEPFDSDISQIGPRHYHLIHNHQSYQVEVIDVNRDEKKCTLRINNNVVEYDIKDKMDLLLERLGMNSNTHAVQNSIKAPMPGLILEVLVEEGQTVNQGDAIVILEAMKMENVIKASGEATVSTINVKKGDSVEKNQVLVSF
jgi:acetyl/propionyl-CoA carboxylase alpha subunit